MPGLEDQSADADFLDILLAYELEVSGARVAVAEDDEVETLLGGQPIVDFASYLRRIKPRVETDEDGIAFLCMEDLIRSEQERRFGHPERLALDATVLPQVAGFPRPPITALQNRPSHPPISAEDRSEWPQITHTDAGTLTDSHIWLGPTQAKARRVKYKSVVFGGGEKTRINNDHCVSLSTDGTLLAAAIRTEIMVWRLQDGLTVQRLEKDGHTGTIYQVAFSPNSQYIVSGAGDMLALVWNIKTGGIVYRLEGHASPVTSAVFSPDGTQIATYSKHSRRLWDALSGELLHTITDLQRTYGADILFSPDSSRITARSALSRTDAVTAVEVFNCYTSERVATVQKPGMICLTFTSEGDRIAAGFRNGSTCVFDAASGKVLLELKQHRKGVQEVAFSPDGGEVATASHDGTVVTWDSRTGERRFTLHPGGIRDINEDCVRAVAYSPRNDFIACGADNHRVWVWYRKTGAFVAAFQGHTYWIRRMIFTPDGWGLLSYGDDNVVRLWSIRDALRLS